MSCTLAVEGWNNVNKLKTGNFCKSPYYFVPLLMNDHDLNNIFVFVQIDPNCKSIFRQWQFNAEGEIYVLFKIKGTDILNRNPKCLLKDWFFESCWQIQQQLQNQPTATTPVIHGSTPLSQIGVSSQSPQQNNNNNNSKKQYFLYFLYDQCASLLKVFI